MKELIAPIAVQLSCRSPRCAIAAVGERQVHFPDGSVPRRFGGENAYFDYAEFARYRRITVEVAAVYAAQVDAAVDLACRFQQMEPMAHISASTSTFFGNAGAITVGTCCLFLLRFMGLKGKMRMDVSLKERSG